MSFGVRGLIDINFRSGRRSLKFLVKWSALWTERCTQPAAAFWRMAKAMLLYWSLRLEIWIAERTLQYWLVGTERRMFVCQWARSNVYCHLNNRVSSQSLISGRHFQMSSHNRGTNFRVLNYYSYLVIGLSYVVNGNSYLRNYEVMSAFFWDFTQRRMGGAYRNFGSTCRPHLQRSSRLGLLDPCTAEEAWSQAGYGINVKIGYAEFWASNCHLQETELWVMTSR